MYNFPQLRGYGSKSRIQKSPTINHLGLAGNEPCKHSRKCIKRSILFSYVLILHVLFAFCVLSFLLSYLFSHFHCSLNSLCPLCSLSSHVLSVLLSSVSSVLPSRLFSQFSCSLCPLCSLCSPVLSILLSSLFSQFFCSLCSLSSLVLTVLSLLSSSLFSQFFRPLCSQFSALSVVPSSVLPSSVLPPSQFFCLLQRSLLDSLYSCPF